MRVVVDGLAEALALAISTRKRNVIPEGRGKKSAVLMPMFERDGEAHVVLLRRSENLRRHGGQVAFPGGRYEPEDASLEITALREAEEEIGLARADVRVIGALDDLYTFTGYVITPYAAWLDREVSFKPNPSEVSRVFSAPLSTFLQKPSGFFPRAGHRIDGEFVWGATSMILKSLLEVLRAAEKILDDE
jgi:8-oxo-dGTP pyrophosphatase MutT (NUDIX family)